MEKLAHFNLIFLQLGGGRAGWGGMVDVNEELKVLRKYEKQVAQRATIAHLTTSKYFLIVLK